MADPNFDDVLSLKPSEVEKPKPRPIGTYLGAVQKYELRDVETKAGTKKVLDFSIKALMAKQVDDEDALKEQGDVTDWYPFQYSVFYETPEGRYNLKQFVAETLGVDPGEGKNEKSLGEMVAATPGSQLLFTLKHEHYMSKAGTPEIATRIASVAKA